MMLILKQLLLKIIEQIDAGTTNLSEEECLKAIDYIKELSDKDKFISKYEAYSMIGCSPATFDRLVYNGKIPKGIKQSGFKELMWKYKDIEKYINNYKNEKETYKN